MLTENKFDLPIIKILQDIIAKDNEIVRKIYEILKWRGYKEETYQEVLNLAQMLWEKYKKDIEILC